MVRRAEMTTETGLKNFPDIPSQEKLDYLATYVDSKSEPLYSLVFGYQLIDGFLRGLILSATQNRILADARGMKQLIKNFETNFPNISDSLVSRLNRRQAQRNLIVHRWLHENEISRDPKRLEIAIQETAELGRVLFSELRNVRTKRACVVK